MKMDVVTKDPPTYFISGHLDLTHAEFNEHYAPRLLAAHENHARFVVGDAPGTDEMAQRFLYALGAQRPAGDPLRGRQLDVRVFHMFEAPRHNCEFPTVGGFTSDAARDAAMTAASLDDIAWVRPGREKSGTAKNLARRVRGR